MSFSLLQFSNNKHAIIDLEALIALHSKTTETKTIKGKHKNNKFNYEQSFRFCLVVFLRGARTRVGFNQRNVKQNQNFGFEQFRNLQLNLRYQSKM